jgi:hypothetical protein
MDLLTTNNEINGWNVDRHHVVNTGRTLGVAGAENYREGTTTPPGPPQV